MRVQTGSRRRPRRASTTNLADGATPVRLFLLLLVPACMPLMACGGAAGDADDDGYAVDPQLVFWDELQALCGHAYPGRVVESMPAIDPTRGDGTSSGREDRISGPDLAAFEAGPMVLSASSCDVAEVRFDVVAGEDRSRQWVVTPTAVGLRLTHELRREAGSAEGPAGYGGETYGPGTETVQRFPIDGRSLALLPGGEGLEWTLRLHPDSLLVYERARDSGDARLRVEVDLTAPLPAR